MIHFKFHDMISIIGYDSYYSYDKLARVVQKNGLFAGFLEFFCALAKLDESDSAQTKYSYAVDSARNFRLC